MRTYEHSDGTKSDSAAPAQPSVGRRSVARGAAWTLPVVALGQAAPARAVSIPICVPSNIAPVITKVNCNAFGVGAPYFKICNTATCNIVKGTVITVTSVGTLTLDVDLIGSQNGFQLLNVIGNTATLRTTQDILPGQCLNYQVYNASIVSGGTSFNQTITLTFGATVSTIAWSRVCFLGSCVFTCA